jgi:energy-coupling factor transport system ATP-binding protein
MAAEDVLATISRLTQDLALTVVIAEHRMERVVPFVDRIAIVENGRVRIGDPAEALIESPVAPPIVELGRLAGWRPLPLSVRDARSQARTNPLTLGKPEPRATHTGECALSARDIVVQYGTKVAVNRVDVNLNRGEVLALMGRNGCGKSSLMWALQGTGRRTGGTVDVDGDDPADLKADEARMLVGLVPQTAADLLYLESVADECAAADQHAGAEAGTTRALLDRLAPGIEQQKHPRDLSEGQRLSLVLAIVLSAEPEVVLLDEPTRGLDYPAKHALAEMLADLAHRRHAIMVSTHDVEFVAQVADRAIVMADGDIVSQGLAADVLAESPAFAPQVSKILGPEWLTIEQVQAARESGASDA